MSKNKTAASKKKTAKKKPGGQSYEPTEEDRRMVAYMSIADIPRERIARAIGITRPTLNKYYKHELENAQNMFIGKCVGKLSWLVEQGEPSAVYFALKTKGRWRETEKIKEQVEELTRAIERVVPKVAEKKSRGKKRG